MIDLNATIQAKGRHAGELMKKANVVGVGVGYKEKDGRQTDSPSVVVMVRKKEKLTNLKSHDIIPSQVENAATDVISVGDIRALQGPKDRWRPAPGGVSIGHFSVTAGTLGAWVRDRATGEALILSNNHVMANCNDAAEGDDIIQPGDYDGGKVPDDIIAHLLRFIPLQYDTGQASCPISKSVAGCANLLARLSGSHHRLVAVREQAAANLVDAAVARPVFAEVVKDEILSIGTISGTKEASLGMAVRKSGRTTGFTTGTVTLLDATVKVNYSSNRTATFTDQIITNAMSQGGDSGSLLVDGAENLAVGLLFAGSDQTTIHSPIGTVLDALNIRFG